VNAIEQRLEQASSQRRRGLRTLLLVVAIFVAPVMASWVLYLTRDHWGLSMGNYGELIEPARPLTGLTLERLEGGSLSIDELRGKWVLVYIGSSNCASPCQESLYKMRQVRLALNEDMRRVHRLLILTDQEKLAKLREGLKPYPGMIVVATSDDRLTQVRREFGLEVRGGESIYLVDPLGNLMMRYDTGAEPKGMLKDLRRLLKASRIG
jgi:cytochrome oxidase Cu insertion factor (SCO1/SenC/PrrC family)